MKKKIITITEVTFEKEALRKDGVPVLVDFWASWCGPCRAMEPVLESLADELDGRAVFAKVNVDEEPVIANAARIRSIPTMVLFKDGDVRDIFVGLTGKNILRDKISNLADERKDGAPALDPAITGASTRN